MNESIAIQGAQAKTSGRFRGLACVPRRFPAAAVMLAVLLAAIVLPARPAAAIQDTAASARLTDDAARLIRERRYQEALDLLARAIAADEDHWEAHYQSGRAYALLERYIEARDALLRASQLNPGHAHTHELAWQAAWRIGDHENAWDQAIRASLAGTDMNQRFLEMFQESAPPEDFELRIRSPRIYVAAVDTREVAARGQLPFNRNPSSGGIGTISGRPDHVEGVNRVNENAFDLLRLRDSARQALFRAPYLGAVLDLERADLILGISVDSLGEGKPVSMEGYLRLYDAASGEVVYYRSLSLRDISSETYLFGELERHINDLQKWAIERR
jgi:tetratricopeptide (TPR) repeat protein